MSLISAIIIALLTFNSALAILLVAHFIRAHKLTIKRLKRRPVHRAPSSFTPVTRDITPCTLTPRAKESVYIPVNFIPKMEFDRPAQYSRH